LRRDINRPSPRYFSPSCRYWFPHFSNNSAVTKLRQVGTIDDSLSATPLASRLLVSFFMVTSSPSGSPPLQKNYRFHDTRRDNMGRLHFYNLIGDPFALATVSIAIVRSLLSSNWIRMVLF
jgi:hypothetical protein